MADDIQDSWNRLMVNKAKRPALGWLAVGMIAGIGVQVGPSVVAGALDWSVW